MCVVYSYSTCQHKFPKCNFYKWGIQRAQMLLMLQHYNQYALLCLSHDFNSLFVCYSLGSLLSTLLVRWSGELTHIPHTCNTPIR